MHISTMYKFSLTSLFFCPTNPCHGQLWHSLHRHCYVPLFTALTLIPFAIHHCYIVIYLRHHLSVYPLCFFFTVKTPLTPQTPNTEPIFPFTPWAEIWVCIINDSCGRLFLRMEIATLQDWISLQAMEGFGNCSYSRVYERESTSRRQQWQHCREWSSIVLWHSERHKHVWLAKCHTSRGKPIVGTRREAFKRASEESVRGLLIWKDIIEHICDPHRLSRI